MNRKNLFRGLVLLAVLAIVWSAYSQYQYSQSEFRGPIIDMRPLATEAQLAIPTLMPGGALPAGVATESAVSITEWVPKNDTDAWWHKNGPIIALIMILVMIFNPFRLFGGVK